MRLQRPQEDVGVGRAAAEHVPEHLGHAARRLRLGLLDLDHVQDPASREACTLYQAAEPEHQLADLVVASIFRQSGA